MRIVESSRRRLWRTGVNTSFLILACSGPGAGAAIQQSIIIGYFCAAIGAVITLALAYDSWRMGYARFTLTVALLMLFLHPAWTISAIHGDCGFLKRDVSYFFTAIYLGLMTYQYVVSKRAI